MCLTKLMVIANLFFCRSPFLTKLKGNVIRVLLDAAAVPAVALLLPLPVLLFFPHSLLLPGS